MSIVHEHIMPKHHVQECDELKSKHIKWKIQLWKRSSSAGKTQKCTADISSVQLEDNPKRIQMLIKNKRIQATFKIKHQMGDTHTHTHQERRVQQQESWRKLERNKQVRKRTSDFSTPEIVGSLFWRQTLGGGHPASTPLILTRSFHFLPDLPPLSWRPNTELNLAPVHTKKHGFLTDVVESQSLV